MKITRSHLGLLVVALGFIASAVHVLRGPAATAPTDKTVLRIGHWLMHAGMREAFDEAARRYELEHPDVHIEQIVVPIRSYPAWTRTQLVGGTAPDITGLHTVDSQMMARYFVPLNDALAQPNPYHVGTPLEGQPWRETFADGLDSIRALTPATGDIAGIALQINTRRLYTNLDLLQRITGQTTPPRTYEEFQALGAQVEAYNRERPAATGITTIAMCGPYFGYLRESLLPSQTQKLAERVSPMRNLKVDAHEEALLILDGTLDPRLPDYQSSFDLLRDVSSMMPPGFEQFQRDDALFMFLQGRAVTFIAGSWDYGVLVRDGPFPVAVTRVPIPDTDDPTYGRFTLGPPSEAAAGHEAAMGIVRHSKNQALALDFLRFLTKPEIAQMFSDYSHRVSAVIGVKPPEGAEELAPQLEGATGGLHLDALYLGARHTMGLFARKSHLITGTNSSVEAFTTAIEQELPDNLRADLGSFARTDRQEVERADALIGLRWTRPGGPDAHWRQTIESQNFREVRIHEVEQTIAESLQ